MKYNKTFEEEASEAVEGMSIEELEMAIKVQDNEMMKHMLDTIGEIVGLIEEQGKTVEKLTGRVEQAEENMNAVTELVTQVAAKVQVIGSMQQGE